MAYDKQTWQNGQTPLNDERLNHIEDAIESIASQADSAGYDASGWHLTGYPAAMSGTQFVNDTVYYSPFIVRKQVTIGKLGFGVGSSGTGSTGAVARIGIYSSVDGLPGARLLDAGTSSATISTSSTGVISGLSLVLNPGTYFTAFVIQGSPVTRPYIIPSSLPVTPLPSVGSYAATLTITMIGSNLGYTQASVSGALPSTATPTVSGASSVPQIAYAIV